MMAMIYRRRKIKAKKTPKRPLRKGRRDVAAICFTARAGAIEADAPAEWLWCGTTGAKSAACRRFRQFTEHGYVRTWVRDLRLPNRYTATRKGADWVGLNHEQGHVFRTQVRADTAGSDHIVLTAKTWAAIGRRLSEPGSPPLARFVTEGEIRHVINGKGVLIPDCIAVIGEDDADGDSAGNTHRLAIEVDLGSERLEILAAKFAKYRPYLVGQQAFVGLRLTALLVIAPGISRLARLAIEAQRADLGRKSYFLDAKDVSFRTVLDQLATIETLVVAANDGINPFTISLLGALPCA
jgi:hypothetical protein